MKLFDSDHSLLLIKHTRITIKAWTHFRFVYSTHAVASNFATAIFESRPPLDQQIAELRITTK